MKKIDNKDIFDCNLVLEQDAKKDIFRFKLAFNRIDNLVGLFQTHDLYKETRFIDKVRGTLNKKYKFSIIDLIDIIFDKRVARSSVAWHVEKYLKKKALIT